MLWTIIVILLILWLLGFKFNVGGTNSFGHCAYRFAGQVLSLNIRESMAKLSMNRKSTRDATLEFTTSERALFYLGLIGFAFCAVIVRVVFFSGPINVSQAAVGPSVPAQIEVGPAVESLLAEFHSRGLDSTPLMKVSNPFLSADGVLVSFKEDNIQIFAYPNNEAASADARKLVQGYTDVSRKDLRATLIHLYKGENILVLYVGNKTNILSSLGATLGPTQ